MSNALPQNLANAVAGQYELNIKAIFREAWQKVYGEKKSLWGAIALMLLVTFGVILIENIFGYFAKEHGWMLAFSILELIGSLLQYALNIFFGASLAFIAVNHIAGRPISAGMIFSFAGPWKKLLSIALISFLVTTFSILIISFIYGFSTVFFEMSKAVDILFLIISIILLVAFVLVYMSFMIGFYLAAILVLEKKLMAWAAIKVAIRAIYKKFFKNILLLFSSVVFITVGLTVTLGIGAIWLLPMLYNITAIQYREIFSIEQ